MSKRKRKRAFGSVILIIGLLIVGVFGYLLFTGRLPIVLGEPQTCDVTPGDYRCFCGEGQEKLSQGLNQFVCESIPTLPSVEFPIDTWGEARAYAVEQGLDMCTGDAYMSDFPLDKQVEGISEVDCRKQTGIMQGLIVWRTMFNTDNGNVLQRDCNVAFMGECPESIAIGNLEDPPELDIEGYLCNTQELDTYIKSLEGLDNLVIVDKLRTACENPTGTPVAHNPPFKDPLEVYLQETIHNQICYKDDGRSYVCGGEDYRKVVCVAKLEGASLGLWGAKIYIDGSVRPSGPYCSQQGIESGTCNPNDPRYTTFKMVDVGLCYRIPEDKTITVYRLSADRLSCSEHIIPNVDKLSTDYDSLSECEDNIEQYITWTADMDKCIQTAYNRYDDSYSLTGLQWSSANQFCYSGGSSASKGCADVVVADDLTTESCQSLGRALFCGVITPQQFKDTAIEKRDDCITGL